MIIHTDYLIIGLSAAGLHAAQTLRRLDPTCSIVAVDSQKTLFNKCFFTSFNSGYKQLNEFELRCPEWFNEQRIDRYHAQIVSLNPSTKVAIDSNDNHYHYSKVLIAVGTTAKTFPTSDSRIVNYHIIQDAKKLQSILMGQKPQTALIIGGGLNGIEIAQLLTKQNIKVTVLEQKAQLISSALSAPSQEWLRDYLKNSVDVQVNTKVEKLEIAQNLVVAHAQSVSYRADILINCVGTVPNTQWLQNTIECSTRGHILVNAAQQTANPSLFAAGDCALFKSSKQFSSLWTDAALQGIHAAYCMLDIPHPAPTMTDGGDTKFPDFPVYWRGDLNNEHPAHTRLIEKNDLYYRELLLDKGQKLRGFILIGTLKEAGQLTQQFLRD